MIARPAAQPRTRSYLGLLPSRGEAIGFILLSLPLLVTFATIDVAKWVTLLPPFPYEVALALVPSYYIARFIGSKKASLTLGLATGLASSIGQGIYFLGDTTVQAMGTVLLVAIWWATFLTSWLAYRRHSAPLLLTPSLVVLFIALGFLPARYSLMIGLYLVASAPAMAHFHLQRWTLAKVIGVPRLSTLVLGVGVMAVIVVGAWLTPTHSEGIRPAFLKKVEDPLFDLIERASGLLASVPNRREWPTFDLGAGLPFTGPVVLTDDVIMIVKSPSAQKWRMRVYETYTPQGWTRPSEGAEGYRYRYSHVLDQTIISGVYKIVPIEVRTFTSMNLMASAGEPLDGGNEGKLELSPLPQFTLELTGAQGSYLPPGVETMRQNIIIAQNSPEATEEPDYQILSLLHAEDLSATAKIAGVQDQVTVVRLREPASALAIRFDELRAPPRSYETTGAVSAASLTSLRQFNGEIPRWIADRYLQLPPDFPDEVRVLAEEVAQDLQSPYDIAIAIQTQLRGLPYSREIVPPPPGVDGVLWFLTVQQVGFCQYYASAMITMLRSLGIPARLVTGFAPGEWDNERNAWVVRARHYHAWPEVYMPGHGWVEFEPTPANVQPSLQHLGFSYEPEPVDLLSDFGTGPCLVDGFDPFAPCDEEATAAFLEEQAADTSKPADEDAAGVQLFNVPVRSALYWLAGAVGLALAVFLGATLVARRPILRSRRAYPDRIFSFMAFLGMLAGNSRKHSDTPDEYGARLALLLPEHAGAVTQITEAYRLVRYGRSKLLTPSQLEVLRSSWPPVRRALLWRALGRLRPHWPFGTRKLQLAPSRL